MKRTTISLITLLLAVGITLLPLGGAVPAFAQRNSSPSPSAPKGAVVDNTAVPAAQVFSCGGNAFQFVSVGVTTHGNINFFTSPSGINNIFGSRSGYVLCVDSSVKASDNGGTEAGWSAFLSISQPNGPNTFPLRITRTTADGAFTVFREITGNSFVMTVPGAPNVYDLNNNDKLCDTLGECGNCTNRTIHVLTRITNNSGLSHSVAVIEEVDFDAGGTDGNEDLNTWAHTSDSVLAFESRSATDSIDSAFQGMLLQALILPSNPSKYASADGVVGDCIGGTFGLDGTVVGDNEAYLRTPFGTLGNGANTGNAIRVHYRRY